MDARNLLVSRDPPAVPPSFAQEQDSMEILRHVFGVAFVNTIVGLEQLRHRKVEVEVVNDMLGEHFSGGRAGKQEGISAHEECERRVMEKLKARYGG